MRLRTALIIVLAPIIVFGAMSLYDLCGIISCQDIRYFYRETPQMRQFLASLREVGGVSKTETIFPCGSDYKSVAYRCRFKVDETSLFLAENWTNKEFSMISIPHHWDNGGRNVHLAMAQAICRLSKDEADQALIDLEKQFASGDKFTSQTHKVGQCKVTLLMREALFAPEASLQHLEVDKAENDPSPAEGRGKEGAL
jgi:hypothetical protein